MSLILLQQSFIHEEFDKNRTFACNLHVYYRRNRFTYMVTNITRNTCLLFKEFKVDGAQPFLHDLALEHEEISRFYRSADVVFGDVPFSLVPAPLFAEKHAQDYFDLAHQPDISAQVISAPFEHYQVTSVLSVNTELWKHFKSFFQSFRILNEGTILYDWLATHAETREGNAASVMLYPDHFILAISRNGSLELANRFPMANQEELLYFIANSCEQLHIDPASLSLYLAGDVDNLGQVIGYLTPYVNKAEVMPVNDAFDVAIVADSTLLTRYFTLLQGSQCAL